MNIKESATAIVLTLCWTTLLSAAVIARTADGAPRALQSARAAMPQEYRAAQARTYKVLHTFTNGPDGANPQAALLLDRSGLYGTTYEGGNFDGGTVFKINHNDTESVLYRFSGSAGPLGSLIRDSAGNLYGTTLEGGTAGLGRVFQLSPSGTETDLHSFVGSDGAYPRAGLRRDAAGNLYGTTDFGGNADYSQQNKGYGTVFALNAAGRETVSHAFTGGTDGFQPYGAVVADRDGNLYGTTLEGGSSNCQGQGCGTVFKVSTRTGQETALYRFTGLTDGAFPNAVIRDAYGNLFGTTQSGGASHLYGTVFKVDPSGRETVLYNFTGGADGGGPAAGLIADASGNLYGTTEFGGDLSCSRDGISGCGTVFELDPAHRETVLYRFTGKADGLYPVASLVMDAAGNLYGTASHGGASKCENGLGCGVVFELDLSTATHSFRSR